VLFYGVVSYSTEEAVELFTTREEADAIVQAWDRDEPEQVGTLRVEALAPGYPPCNACHGLTGCSGPKILRRGVIMKRVVIGLASVVALAFAVPAGADPPTEFPVHFAFVDVNPCTGDPMTVTIVGTSFVHFHGSRVVARAQRTITTSDGFVGHGTDNFIDNGQVVMFRQTDIVANASGDRFRARSLIVGDISTDTVRVDRSELTCLGP
jgi:hypothetical protein